MKVGVRIGMSDQTTTLAVPDCAESIAVETVQIEQYSISDGEILFTASAKIETREPVSDETQDDGQEDDMGGFVFGEDRDDDHDGRTPDENSGNAGGSAGPWTVNGEEFDHRELQKAVSDLCDDGIVEWPGNSGDKLAETLRSVAEAPENDESDTPESDGDDDTPASGGSSEQPMSKEIDGKMRYYVNGEYRTYNHLQKRVSASDRPFPDDKSGETLAEMVRDMGNDGETTGNGGSEDTQSDTTPASGVSTLPDYGSTTDYPHEDEIIDFDTLRDKLGSDVSGTEVSKIRHYQGLNGLCQSCEIYGANKGSEVCKQCEKGNAPTTSGSDQDRGSRVQKVAKTLKVSQKMAENAVEAVEEGLVDTEGDYVKLQS